MAGVRYFIGGLKKTFFGSNRGKFDLRDSRMTFRKKVQRQISNNIGCIQDMSRGEVYSKLHAYLHTLGELQNIVDNSMKSIIMPVIERLQDTTEEVLGELCPDEDISFYNGIHHGFFQVWRKIWTTKVHFGWIPLNEKAIVRRNRIYIRFTR